MVLALGVSMAALLIAPVAANACASLAGVKSFHGGASLAFSSTASGTDSSNGGTEKISLDRTVSDVKLKLTRRGSIPGYVVLFAGQASGGEVSVHDSFENVGDAFENASGDNHATFSGPLTNKLPNVSAAQLEFFTKTCKYLLYVEFGVKTTFSGNPADEPNNDAEGGAYGGDHHTPSSLNLGGAPAPPAYSHSCESVKHQSQGCYWFGGNWDTDFEDLKTCQGTCGSSHNPVGNALFSWALEPRFTPPKK